MQSAPAHSDPSEHGRSRVRGGRARTWAGVWQKQAASDAHAHGSVKISGKTLFVQHKKGLKALKNPDYRAKPWA